MNADYKNFIVEKCEMCLSNDSFSPDMYAKHDVKKGLRDSHGNGVVVGLTTVSQVNGTKIVNGEKVPARGTLRYRGYDIVDLTNGFIRKRFGFEEITYLLLFGELPNQEELDEFKYYLFHNGHRITFYPYKGWFSGKGIKDGRGIETLIKRLNHAKGATISDRGGNHIKSPESV